jgi:hypothetical protein
VSGRRRARPTSVGAVLVLLRLAAGRAVGRWTLSRTLAARDWRIHGENELALCPFPVSLIAPDQRRAIPRRRVHVWSRRCGVLGFVGIVPDWGDLSAGEGSGDGCEARSSGATSAVRLGNGGHLGCRGTRGCDASGRGWVPGGRERSLRRCRDRAVNQRTTDAAATNDATADDATAHDAARTRTDAHRRRAVTAAAEHAQPTGQ